MASDTLRTLSVQVPDPERLKRLVAELRRFLDRADELSQGQPPLRKEIALVYRQVGDFAVHDAQGRRLRTKRRRPRPISARPPSPRASEPANRRGRSTQLSELGDRLQALGSPLDVTVESTAAPRTLLRQRHRQRPRRPRPLRPGRPPPEPAAATVDREQQAELMQRLKTTSANAERARRNLEALRDSLAGRGQTVRPDLLTSMGAIDSFIEDARSSLESNDLTAAEESLRRAASELRKLFNAVGG